MDKKQGKSYIIVYLLAILLAILIAILLAILIAILLAILTTFKITLTTKFQDFGLWATLICAYNIGAVVITFGYPLFMSQGGIEFWLLNMAVFVADYNRRVPQISQTKNMQICLNQ